MRVATIKIKGITPYSPSKAFTSEHREKESPEQFDIRCWKEHAHVDATGNIVLPSVSIGKAIVDSAAFLSKGGFLQKKGSSTWKENFERGLAISKSPTIGATVDDMKAPEMIYAHADGNKKSGKRVWRRFPIFPEWSATLVIHVLDDSIPESVFKQVMEACGLFNGFGRYSPRVGGHNGRFVIEEFEIK